jgi:hypothetical protein
MVLFGGLGLVLSANNNNMKPITRKKFWVVDLKLELHDELGELCVFFWCNSVSGVNSVGMAEFVVRSYKREEDQYTDLNLVWFERLMIDFM